MSIRIWFGLRSHLSLRNTHISSFSSLAQVVKPQVTQLPPLVPRSARWDPPSMAEQLRSGDLNACMRLLGSYHSQVPVTPDGRDLSTLRLRSATTTLIHGLIRRNQVGLASDIIAEALQGRVPESAGSSAVLPLSRRVRFRTPTLQATIANLTMTGQGHSAASYLRDHRDLRRWSHVVGAQLSLTSSLLSPSTRNSPEAARSREYAKRSVALLNAFRHYRYRRTDTMYDNVINACIIHGEILTATLLFVVLVKDWQMRQAVRSAIAASSSAPVPAVLDAHHFDTMGRDALLGILDPCAKQTGHPLGEVRACGLHKVSLPYPSPSLLLRILHAIPPVKSSEGLSPLLEPDPDRDKYKEALAYLSVLLYESSFPPTSRVSRLIKLLSQYSKTADDVAFSPSTAQHRWRRVFAPSSNERAWRTLPASDARMLTEIVKRATRESRKRGANSSANAFFIQTLHRFIHQRSHSRSRRLDPRSYNALLSYTLTSLRDVPQTVEVLRRMHRAGWEADVVTLNTLLRGASVLRLNGVVEAVMGVFRALEGEGGAGKGVSALRLAEILEESGREREAGSESRSDLPLGDQSAHGSLSSSDISSSLITHSSASRTPIAPDAYTLSSLLAHITSSGITPPTALSLLHSITSSQPPVQMDSVLYTTLINMCAKAGMVGHVERLFFAAKEAEGEGWDGERLRASLLPVVGTTPSPSALHSHSHREPPPLIVPIQAYTILLQSYARERRKRGLARGYSLSAHRSGVLGPEFVEASPRRDVALATAKGVYDGVFGTAVEMMDELIGVCASAGDSGEGEETSDPSADLKVTLLPSLPALREVVRSVPVPDERFFEAARRALVGSTPRWVGEDRDQNVLDEYEEGMKWEMGKRLEMDRSDLGFPSSFLSAPPLSRRRLRAA